MSQAIRDAAASVALVSLGITFLWPAVGRSTRVPRVSLLPFVAFGALVATQLLPLPRLLLSLLAPGPADLWFPSLSVARDVLGPAWRPVSVAPGETLSWLALIVGLAGLSVVAAPALAVDRMPRPGILVVLGGALGLSVYGIVAQAAFGLLLYGRVPVPTLAPFGPFVSKNHFAGYLAPMALLASGMALGLARQSSGGRGILGWTARREAPAIVACLALAALLCLAVPVSLSRGGSVSLAAGLLTLAALRLPAGAWRRRGTPGLALIAAGAGALVLAMLLALPPRAVSRMATVTAGTQDISVSFRLGVWRDSLDMLGASPLVGHGLGAFGAAFPRYKTGYGTHRVAHAENHYLELLAEAGVTGAGLVVLGFVSLLRQRSSLAAGGPTQRGLRHGALAGLAALAVHDLFDFNLRIPSNAAVAALLSGIILSSWPTQPVRRTVRAAAGIVALVLAAALIGPIVTERGHSAGPPRWSEAAGPASPLRLKRFEADLVHRLRWQPADAEAWLQLAWVATIRGQPERGARLLDHASSLDPHRSELQKEADRLRAAARRLPGE